MQLLEAVPSVGIDLLGIVESQFRDFTSGSEKNDGKGVHTIVTAQLKKLEDVFKKFPKADPATKQVMGTDPGDVYAVPIINPGFVILVKISGGNMPKIEFKKHTAIKDGSSNMLDTSDVIPNSQIQAHGNVCGDTCVKVREFHKSVKKFGDTSKGKQQSLDKNLKQLNTGQRQSKEFLANIENAMKLTVALSKGMWLFFNSINVTILMLDKVLPTPS